MKISSNFKTSTSSRITISQIKCKIYLETTKQDKKLAKTKILF